jgi:hypothetical protein
MKRYLLSAALALAASGSLAAQAPENAPSEPATVTVDLDMTHLVALLTNLIALDGRVLPDVVPPGRPPKREPYDIADAARIAAARDMVALRTVYEQVKAAGEKKIAADFDKFAAPDAEPEAPGVLLSACERRKLDAEHMRDCNRVLVAFEATKFPVTLYLIAPADLNVGKNRIDVDVLSFIEPVLKH